MSRDIPFNPEIDPLSIPVISMQNKFLHYQNVLDILRKRSSSPWLFNFGKIFSKYVLKIKTKSHELLNMIGCRITVVKLMVWAGEPQPYRVKSQKIFTKDLPRGTLFFARL